MCKSSFYISFALFVLCGELLHLIILSLDAIQCLDLEDLFERMEKDSGQSLEENEEELFDQEDSIMPQPVKSSKPKFPT